MWRCCVEGTFGSWIARTFVLDPAVPRASFDFCRLIRVDKRFLVVAAETSFLATACDEAARESGSSFWGFEDFDDEFLRRWVRIHGAKGRGKLVVDVHEADVGIDKCGTLFRWTTRLQDESSMVTLQWAAVEEFDAVEQTCEKFR